MKDPGHLVIDGCAGRLLFCVFTLAPTPSVSVALLRRTSCLAGRRVLPVFSSGTPPLPVND